MRTTIDIPDILVRELKNQAARDSTSLKEQVNRILEKGLGRGAAGRSSWKPVSYRMGCPSVDLDRAWEVAEGLETEAVIVKWELRK
jgi:hypothetical protein